MPNFLGCFRPSLAIVISLCMSIIGTAVVAAGQSDDGRTATFRRDIAAVLSKSGCNQGACHGNANGKGGFRLSLRGEDPVGDFRTITHELLGRRIDRMRPGQSLLLKKATMQLAHEGGRRFDEEDPEFRLLADWIGAGAVLGTPEEGAVSDLVVEPEFIRGIPGSRPVPLKVTAVFNEQSAPIDVSRFAVYAPVDPVVSVSRDGTVSLEAIGETTLIVRYLNRQFPVRVIVSPYEADVEGTYPRPVNEIDRQVFAKLEQIGLGAAEICSDTTFLRRAYLDLTGSLPTIAERREFLEQAVRDKRARLVNDLLSRPEFADHWAGKWSDVLRNEERTLDVKGVAHFHRWIRAAIADGVPLNQFAGELVSGLGSSYAEPAANYYRALREPLERSESTAQLFLGVRLQCAKCHNHPFDRWTQDDYYAWGSVFAQVDYKVLENDRRDRNDKHEFAGEQIIFAKTSGAVKDPRTGKSAPARFLGASGDVTATGPERLQALADWLTTGNRQFAECQANRIWYQLMGRGLVDPIDDFRATNPPSHPELLAFLADELADSNFDLRHLIRLIMSSATYQLSSRPPSEAVEMPVADLAVRNYAFVSPRRLSAEQLLDAIAQTLDVPLNFSNVPSGSAARQLPGVSATTFRFGSPTMEEKFLVAFGKPPRLQNCECERSDEQDLSQTFGLVSGPLLTTFLKRPDNRIGHRLQDKVDTSTLLEELYQAALSRNPHEDERTAIRQFIEAGDDQRIAWEDVAWGLLNSNEFLLRP